MEGFEGEEPGNELKYADEVWGGTTVGKKRSRCPYLLDDKNNLESLGLPPELLGVLPSFEMDNNPSIADEKTSSISAKYDSFAAADFEDPWIIETTQDSDVLKEKKTKLKALDLNRRPLVLPCGKMNIILKTRELDIHGALNLNADPEDQNKDEFDAQTGETLEFEVGKLSESSFVLMEDAGRHMTDIMETMLFDVHLTVQARFLEEHVPYVCLTSQGNGKPILGYPLEVGALSDSCDIFLPYYDGGRSKFHQLVWRTSRRTPVCYVTNSHFYTISKNVRNKQEKLPKKPCHSKKVEVVLARDCVPVEYIFVQEVKTSTQTTRSSPSGLCKSDEEARLLKLKQTSSTARASSSLKACEVFLFTPITCRLYSNWSNFPSMQDTIEEM